MTQDGVIHPPLAEWLAEARSLAARVAAADPGAESVVQTLERLAGPAPPSPPKVVVLGEKGRGKSTLVAALASRSAVTALDTPALEGGTEPAWLRETLMAADVAVLVVSATSPLSLSERELITTRLSRGRVPYLIVVITKADLAGAQADRVLAYVTARIGRAAPEAEVVTADAIAEIGALIAARTVDPALPARRVLRDAWALHPLLTELAEHADRTRQVELAARHEEQHEQERSRNRARSRDLAWFGLSLQLAERRVKTMTRAHRTLTALRARMVDELAAEVEEAADVHRWWRTRMPGLLTESFGTVAETNGQRLARMVEKDLTWLITEAEAGFGVRLPVPGRMTATPPAARLPDLDVADHKAWWNAVRSAPQAGRFTGGVLAGHLPHPAAKSLAVPVTEFVAGIVAAAGERILRQTAELQRDRMVQELTAAVGRALDEYTVDLDERLYSAYQSAYRDLDAARREPHPDGSAPDPADAAEWAGLVEQVRRLRRDIAGTLDPAAGDPEKGPLG